jgi:hypothetical protein
MTKPDWNLPETEEGIRRAQEQIEQCRREENYAELGNGLLALGFLVMWVHSDNELSPPMRRQQLALMALDAFRLAGDLKGQVRALIDAIPLADRESKIRMLDEADALATAHGDENLIAMSLAARARAPGVVDRQTAEKLHRQALEMFRRTGNRSGQARCLFSLCLGIGHSREKKEQALEGAQLYHEIGNRREAQHCMMLALLNSEEIDPVETQEKLARDGLRMAEEAGSKGKEALFCCRLASILVRAGKIEEAQAFQARTDKADEEAGVSLEERWDNRVSMMKSAVCISKQLGNTEAAKLFRAELKRVKAEKPG